MEFKPIRAFCSEVADVFQWRKSLQDLQASGIIVSANADGWCRDHTPRLLSKIQPPCF